MTLPTTKTLDVWKLATEGEQIQSLSLLAGLPAREADDVRVDKPAYYIALRGVTSYGLREAVKSILQGGLGHAFFPSPAELRLECDRHMKSFERQRTREKMLADHARENREFDRIRSERSPESVARVKALYERFCADRELGKPEPDRVMLDPELVAQVPDAPTNFRRLGR